MGNKNWYLTKNKEQVRQNTNLKFGPACKLNENMVPYLV